MLFYTRWWQERFVNKEKHNSSHYRKILCEGSWEENGLCSGKRGEVCLCVTTEGWHADVQRTKGGSDRFRKFKWIRMKRQKQGEEQTDPCIKPRGKPECWFKARHAVTQRKHIMFDHFHRNSKPRRILWRWAVNNLTGTYQSYKQARLVPQMPSI